MRLHLMGTAAAEGWPAVWCGCAACERARSAGGKNLRSRAGALIDDDLKIDLPPDTYMQSVRDGINLSKVQTLLITHTHQDHYYIHELAMHFKPFAHDNATLDIYGDHWAIEGIQSQFPRWPEPQNLHTLNAHAAIQIGETTIMPLQASHFPERGCFNYIIQRDGKTLLYGMDSGWFPEESWEAQQAFQFDAVVVDCTHGPIPGGKYHGGTDTVIATKKRMLEYGTASESTLFVANHFSHNGGMLHAELEKELAPHGIQVAYDGMVIVV